MHSQCLKTSVENEDTISDVVNAVENYQKTLLTSVTTDLNSLNVETPEGKNRIDGLLRWELSCPYDEIPYVLLVNCKIFENLWKKTQS
jgi:hypothetical protein